MKDVETVKYRAIKRISAALAAASVATALSLGTAHAANFSSSLPPAPIDHLGRPAPHILKQVRDFANQPWVPANMRNSLLAAVVFYEGGGKPGAELPNNAPNFRQFYWPTVSAKCIGGQLDATGSAIAVPGPAEIPAPGAKEGEVAFVFTALGTGPIAKEQHTSMQVQWLNINNFRFGSTPLVDNGINPQGPATVSATANTGHGTVIAWLSGGVSVAGTDSTPASTCNFAPTAATFTVR
ncbi:hypothetical protein QVA66_03425 [Staphylococcus chromogenes]|nr:hypothetical protein [Staphylococcus chromogenes]